MKVDYHAILHAVFFYPEMAGVSMGEQKAIDKYGKDRVSYVSNSLKILQREGPWR